MKLRTYLIAAFTTAALSASVGLSVEKSGLFGSGDGSESQFIYNSHGRRNPFLPLILPTPIPTATPLPGPEATGGLLGGLLGMIKPPDPQIGEESGVKLPSPTPTQAATPTPTPIVPPELDIRSTIIGSGRPSVVLIGDSILREGDVVSGAEIISISKGQIEILYSGSKFVVKTKSAR